MKKDDLNILFEEIEKKDFSIYINSERPTFVQPEDRINYRSHRIVLILYFLRAKTGLSKEIVACMDFLLRNTSFQRDFVIQYFKEDKAALSKYTNYCNSAMIQEQDKNIVQYKSVPWDIRYNDMFLYLFIRNLITFIGSDKNKRVVITKIGIDYGIQVEKIFPNESNFLELFGKRINEEKAVKIITEVIPNSYWKDNEELIY